MMSEKQRCSCGNFSARSCSPIGWTNWPVRPAASARLNGTRATWASMVDLALALLIWLGVIGAIWRGFRHERRVNRFAFRAWIIFIFIALVFTFRSPPVEAV